LQHQDLLQPSGGKNISDGLRLLGWIKRWRAWAMERETIEMAAWVICRTSKQAATRPSVHGKGKSDTQ